MLTTTLTRRILLVSTLVLLTGSTQQALAQPGSGGPASQDPTDPTQVPLDGGASLLLAGSVAYGLRQLRQRRRK